MKRLLTTAAMALALSTGGAFAETSGTAISNYKFEASTDFYATSFIGMRVYASEQDVDADQPIATEGARSWDDIGEINDLIISQEGGIEAVIVGVGGFLSIGEKSVAVSMDQIKVLRDNDGDRFLVTRVSTQELNAAPAFTAETGREVENATTDQRIKRVELTDAEARKFANYDAERKRLTRPVVQAEAYVEISADELTLDALEDATVVGSDGEVVGEIEQVFITADGAIKRVIVDVGGFLGIGERAVSVSFDEMKLMRRDNSDEIRIYIDATKEVLEAQPAYEG